MGNTISSPPKPGRDPATNATAGRWGIRRVFEPPLANVNSHTAPSARSAPTPSPPASHHLRKRRPASADPRYLLSWLLPAFLGCFQPKLPLTQPLAPPRIISPRRVSSSRTVSVRDNVLRGDWRSLADAIGVDRNSTEGVALANNTLAHVPRPITTRAPVSAPPAPPWPLRAVPTPEQLLYQQRELSMFLHFSMCTFSGCEQNACTSNPPSLFDPSSLNATQWVGTAIAFGAKQICLTARHSGGFALWPSKHTNYSVARSPWRAGQGDVVAEFVAACRAGGVSPCLYFIADWDCYNANETAAVYLSRQQGMLSELLSNYGTIDRLWLDLYGAGCGGGGAAPLCPADVFPMAWKDVVAHVRQVSPSTMMLPGPDGCENPHEAGIGVYPLVNMINATSAPGQGVGHPEMCGHGHNDDPSFQGDARCTDCLYTPHESDLSIQNPGDNWFWRPGIPHLTAASMWNNYLWTVNSHQLQNWDHKYERFPPKRCRANQRHEL